MGLRMFNITNDLNENPGLNAHRYYEGSVTNNNDPEKLGRIKVRVKTILDGIPDDDLPWAIPYVNHPDGATKNSGHLDIPKVGSKVHIQFQDGNPMYPMYKGHHIDKTTKLQEGDMHYPNRKVFRLQNKCLVVIDTEDNILYLRNPGTTKIYIDGNVELEVTGNVTEKIKGNVNRHILGNLEETIDGNYHRKIKGNSNLSVSGNVADFAGGTRGLRSGGVTGIDASSIYENSGQAANDPGAAPVIEPTPWDGIRGGSKGENS